jgi:hypothetical protein
MRFEFLDGDKVCASGYMKGAAVSRDGLVENANSYAALKMAVLPNAVPEAVQHWLAAEKTVITQPWQ